MNSIARTLTHEDLSQFNGDVVRYRHTINRNVIYTPGVQYLAETGGAYWLVDVIASYLTPGQMARAAKQDDRILSLHFWKLTVREDNSATVEARVDSPCKPFISQEIPFTDFPLETVDIWAGWDTAYWTLYLPSEH